MTDEPLKDPIAQFRVVFELAQINALSDPTAMVLSTCTRDGHPSSRIVLLKEVTDLGFVFFTNYHSRKSREMSVNPRAALCFYWPAIDQQVRVEGTITKISIRDSDDYFAARARISQLGAWASDQSQPLRSRSALMDRVEEFDQRFKDAPVPRPSYWGGFLLRPNAMEFWTNGEFRLHDRFRYTLDNDGRWFMQRLNP